MKTEQAETCIKANLPRAINKFRVFVKTDKRNPPNVTCPNSVPANLTSASHLFAKSTVVYFILVAI